MNELFQAIPRILDQFDEQPELREAFIFSAWRKIAGDSLCEHTVPFRLFGKHLTIAVEDQMWKRHLEILSGQMIFKLNSLLNREAVTFIEFRIDRVKVEQVTENQTAKRLKDEDYDEMALKKITPKLRSSADAIKDDNLRYQFLLAAGGCLARKERLKQNSQ